MRKCLSALRPQKSTRQTTSSLATNSAKSTAQRTTMPPKSKKAQEQQPLPDIEDLILKPTVLQSTMINWYRDKRRDLPWRPTMTGKNATPPTSAVSQRSKKKEEEQPFVPPKPRTNAYGIWVSEVMSQQTQISTVVKYWDRWMKEFPTPKELAEASDDKVRAEWAGMGFYRRADNLHKGAQYVVKHFKNCELPTTKKELLPIPGIGNYTAGAISSICNSEQVAAVDGNVLRVLTRIRGDRDVDVKDPRVAKRMEKDIERHVIVGCSSPGEFNQSFMELGSSHCKPNGEPDCDRCPLSKGTVPLCRTFAMLQAGDLTSIDGVIPLKSKKVKQREESVATLVITFDGVGEGMEGGGKKSKGAKKKTESSSTSCSVILNQRPKDGGLLSGMMEFLSCSVVAQPKSTPAGATTTAKKKIKAEENSVGELENKDVISMKKLLTKTFGIKSAAHLTNLSYVGDVAHTFTHIQMTLHCFVLKVSSVEELASVVATAAKTTENTTSGISNSNISVVVVDDFKSLPMSTVTMKVWRKALHSHNKKTKLTSGEESTTGGEELPQKRKKKQ